MTILSVTGVSKHFGSQQVLEEISFELPEHSVLGFIGKNGAGKTTLMKMICGLLPIDQGEIKVCGQKVTYGHNQTNKFIGYLPDVPAFYDYMTSYDYLKLCGELTGMSKAEISVKSEELLELVGLANNQQKIKTYSRGMKQRLGIAQALLNEPKLLICDEPTSALDPVGRKEIIEIISQVRKKTTVIFSTHILSDVEKICDQVVLIDQGKVQLAMPLSKLKKVYGLKQFLVTFAEKLTESQVLGIFEGYRIITVKAEKEYLIEATTGQEPLRQLYQQILAANCYPQGLTEYQPDLETVFEEVVK